MKVVATADVHYGVSNNKPIVKKFAQKIIRTKADVLILVGDTFAIDQKLLVECLELFKKFKGDKLLVAGNHDLWTTQGSSLTIYEKVIPTIAKKCGFHFLDQKPFIKGDVGFVGSIGWYDYSFKDPTLPIPKQYYLEKRWPEVVHQEYLSGNLNQFDYPEKDPLTTDMGKAYLYLFHSSLHRYIPI